MTLYRYNWKNDERRKKLFGKLCVILSRGKKNSVEIEFLDGTREIVSAFALRRSPNFTFANGSSGRRPEQGTEFERMYGISEKKTLDNKQKKK